MHQHAKVLASRSAMDKARLRREIVLSPGEHGVGDEHCCIRTILGSCVSITLWHPLRRIGAMCHFLLSTRPQHEHSELDGRFANDAILLMSTELIAHGVKPAECEAKIFGGASMFQHPRMQCATHVGRANGEAARALLESLRIPIVAESLYGNGHRQVVFDVSTGRVWSRQHALTDSAMPLFTLPASPIDVATAA